MIALALGLAGGVGGATLLRRGWAGRRSGNRVPVAAGWGVLALAAVLGTAIDGAVKGLAAAIAAVAIGALTIVALGRVASRRDKGRAAPRWERLWAGVVGGQPLALAIVALTAIVSPPFGERLVWPWLALTVASLFATGLITQPALRLAQTLRIALGVAIVAVALLHTALATMRVEGVIVDIVLLIVGGWLLWRARAVRVAAA